MMPIAVRPAWPVAFSLVVLTVAAVVMRTGWNGRRLHGMKRRLHGGRAGPRRHSCRVGFAAAIAGLWSADFMVRMVVRLFWSGRVDAYQGCPRPCASRVPFAVTLSG
jgi:hypothetical protein